MSLSHIGKSTGKNNPAWKGNQVSYRALHHWIKRWKGSPSMCEVCCSPLKKKYEWANKDHKYSRVLDDYIRLCTSCHRKYDKNKGIKIN